MSENSFLWGAATSSHQVEGDNVNNDWWEWEHKTAGACRSGKACDHYNRFREDFEWAQKLGHNAHRLSIEWSRVENKRGNWNQREINHYREVLEDLKEREMSTFVTLHHFTNPLWLARLGGWRSSRSPDFFARYVKTVADNLGHLVDYWVTINEPIVYATQSYWRGKWTPRKRSLWGWRKVVKNMARAHKKAYRIIHRSYEQARVGVAKNLIAYVPDNEKRWLDKASVRFLDFWFNRYFYQLTGKHHDFIGVNYYFCERKKFSVKPPFIVNREWSGERSDIGWPIKPKGLTQVLLGLNKLKRPVFVTENGIADAEDKRRAEYVRSHLRAIESAQKKGVDVRGYLHWSLLDNFEWDKGFSPRFGLLEVDYRTMERRPRLSAYVYKGIIDAASGKL